MNFDLVEAGLAVGFKLIKHTGKVKINWPRVHVKFVQKFKNTMFNEFNVSF